MNFASPSAEQKQAGAKWDKMTIIFNADITITKIPLEAYEYVVNGKPTAFIKGSEGADEAIPFSVSFYEPSLVNRDDFPRGSIG
jgi:hypothetical protein